MKQLLEEELLLKRFLLGELSQGDQSEVEERLFSDPEYFKQFRAAEDDLIDEYLYEDLDAGERERFEKYFLTTPERRESLRVAGALRQYIFKNGTAAVAERTDAAPAPRAEKRSILDLLRVRAPALRFSLAAAAVLIIAVGVWLLVRTAPGNEPSPPLQANTAPAGPAPPEVAQGGPGQGNQGPITQPPPARNGGVNAEKGSGVRPERPPRHAPARVYSFLILPLGQVRGEGETNEIKPPADAGVLNLQIPLIEEAGYRRYRVALQTDAGREIKTWGNLKSAEGEAGQTVSVAVPAKSLGQQKYRLVLSGVPDGGEPRVISTLYFKVTK